MTEFEGDEFTLEPSTGGVWITHTVCASTYLVDGTLADATAWAHNHLPRCATL